MYHPESFENRFFRLVDNHPIIGILGLAVAFVAAVDYSSYLLSRPDKKLYEVVGMERASVRELALGSAYVGNEKGIIIQRNRTGGMYLVSTPTSNWQDEKKIEDWAFLVERVLDRAQRERDDCRIDPDGIRQVAYGTVFRVVCAPVFLQERESENESWTGVLHSLERWDVRRLERLI